MCSGVMHNLKGTNTEQEELLLGLIWDFVQDTLKPNTQIYLSKKRRGEHLDEMLCPEVLARTPVTMRTTLCAVGSLYDLSGKFLSPAQMKVTPKWDVEVKLMSSDLCTKIVLFLEELLDV